MAPPLVQQEGALLGGQESELELNPLHHCGEEGEIAG